MGEPHGSGHEGIYLKPLTLLKVIQRENHHISTMGMIAHNFFCINKFTIVDMKHGYWLVPLAKESLILTTFNTSFGFYCFNRLPVVAKLCFLSY